MSPKQNTSGYMSPGASKAREDVSDSVCRTGVGGCPELAEKGQKHSRTQHHRVGRLVGSGADSRRPFLPLAWRKIRSICAWVSRSSFRLASYLRRGCSGRRAAIWPSVPCGALAISPRAAEADGPAITVDCTLEVSRSLPNDCGLIVLYGLTNLINATGRYVIDN